MSADSLAFKALFGILLPALVAGITWGVAWRIWSRSAEPVAQGAWAGALAVGLSTIAGYLGNEDWPGFPPRTAIGWILFISCSAIVAGALIHLLPRTLPIRSVIWLPVVCGSIWVLTATPRANWKGAEFYGWYAALIGMPWIVAMSTESLAEHWPGASIPLSLWVWSSGIAGALAATGSLSYGHLAGILAAAMGAGIVAAWIKPTISFAHGATATLTILGISFLLCGYFYSYLPASSALILAAAPLVLWLGELSFVARRRPWTAVALRASFIAVPVMVALLFAAWPMLFPAPSKNAPGGGAEADFYK